MRFQFTTNHISTRFGCWIEGWHPDELSNLNHMSVSFLKLLFATPLVSMAIPPSWLLVFLKPNPWSEIINKHLTSPHLGVYLYARNIKKNMSRIMRTANMKNSDAWSRAFAEATMMTMMLPKATVSSQAACTTDFMESGAWL